MTVNYKITRKEKTEERQDKTKRTKRNKVRIDGFLSRNKYLFRGFFVGT